MADPDLEIIGGGGGGGGGGVLLALPALLPSAIPFLLFFIPKIRGCGSHGSLT